MSRHRRGFTIIETMLFLALTGVILAGVIVGVSSGVNRERYRDAANSYVNFWQGVYDGVINVKDSVSNNTACTRGSTAGTSQNCMVVGKIIHSTADPKVVTTDTVYATAPGASLTNLSTTSDLNALQSANLVAANNVDEYSLSWGTSLRDNTDGKGSDFSIMVVRMPTSGLVRTYISTSQSLTPAQMVASGTARESSDFTMCVDRAALVASTTLGVKLAVDAVNSSGVSFVGEGGTC